MNRLPSRFLLLWPLAGVLLLSACDDWKLGWPKNLDAGSGSLDAFAQTGGIQYIVTIVCGSNSGGPLVAGKYGTLINIYNPSGGPISVSMRVSQSIPEGNMIAGDISGFVNKNISAFRAIEVDCDSISSEFIGGTTTGVLVVQSSTPIEVSATYTAGGVEVNSMHVVRIAAR